MKVKCPECKKYTEWNDNKWRPFCSERCKQIDLAAWADEDYRIPEDPAEKSSSSDDSKY